MKARKSLEEYLAKKARGFSWDSIICFAIAGIFIPSSLGREKDPARWVNHGRVWEMREALRLAFNIPECYAIDS